MSGGKSMSSGRMRRDKEGKKKEKILERLRKREGLVGNSPLSVPEVHSSPVRGEIQIDPSGRVIIQEGNKLNIGKPGSREKR